MNPAIINPFLFSSFGTVTHVNEEEKTAAVTMEDKSGFCLVRYQQADSLKKGDILDLGSRKPGTNPDIFNQTQHKKITGHILQTNMAEYQLKRYFEK